MERIPTAEELYKLQKGVVIQGRKTLPCRAWILDPQPEVVGLVTSCEPSGEIVLIYGARRAPRATIAPKLPPRDPPIRFRKNVPTCWIGLELIEGKNRQVRRMTAAIGHPTLRLIRVRIARLDLGDLPAGAWKVLEAEERKLAEPE